MMWEIKEWCKTYVLPLLALAGAMLALAILAGGIGLFDGPSHYAPEGYDPYDDVVYIK